MKDDVRPREIDRRANGIDVAQLERKELALVAHAAARKHFDAAFAQCGEQVAADESARSGN